MPNSVPATVLMSLVMLAATSACGPANRDEPPAMPVESDDLTGVEWKLEAVGVPGAEAPPVAGTEVSLTFDADGKLTGNAGCNRFFGPYEIGEDDTLSIGPMGATRMACPPEIMSQEDAVLGAFVGVTRFEIDGDRLTITSPGEGFLIRFVAVREPEEREGVE